MRFLLSTRRRDQASPRMAVARCGCPTDRPKLVSKWSRTKISSAASVNSDPRFPQSSPRRFSCSSPAQRVIPPSTGRTAPCETVPTRATQPVARQLHAPPSHPPVPLPSRPPTHRHVAALGTQQEADGARDLLRLAHALHRDRVGKVAGRVGRLVEDLLQEGRLDPARRDDVDADLLGGVLLGHRLRKADERVLGRALGPQHMRGG